MASNDLGFEVEELFDKISNFGREWAQLVNRIRIVFERPTYIFPARDAVYLWRTYKQKMATRQEISSLLMRIIKEQDSGLLITDVQTENKVYAMWKHAHYLNERRLYDLTQKFLNLPFVPMLISESRLPFYDELLAAEKPKRKRRKVSTSNEYQRGASATAHVIATPGGAGSSALIFDQKPLIVAEEEGIRDNQKRTKYEHEDN